MNARGETFSASTPKLDLFFDGNLPTPITAAAASSPTLVLYLFSPDSRGHEAAVIDGSKSLAVLPQGAGLTTQLLSLTPTGIKKDWYLWLAY